VEIKNSGVSSFLFKMRQKTRHVIYGVAAGACVPALLLGGLLIRNEMEQARKQKEIERQYEVQIDDIRQKVQASQIKGWALNRTVAPGEKVGPEDLIQVELPKTSVPGNVLGSKDQIIGKTAKIKLDSHTLLTSALLDEGEATTDDLRNREMSFIQLPSSLQKGDVIDIRIQFPTGEDYILLSKKKVLSLTRPTLAVTLDEHEILSLSSAIVDAYLHKASIYAITYVEPGLQEKAIPTYPANGQVLKLISRDPNIIAKAENGLKNQASRDLLEKSLSSVPEQSSLEFASQQAAAASAAIQLNQSKPDSGPNEEFPKTDLVGK
jgi:hypothetical protein